MLALPTVLLHHVTDAGSHYDWLLGDPMDVTGRLWTARVGVPSRHWRDARRFAAEPLGPHRRRYLTYEGEIGGGRGRVTRTDRGVVIPRLWTRGRIVVQVRMTCFTGLIDLRRGGPALWRARCLAL